MRASWSHSFTCAQCGGGGARRSDQKYCSHFCYTEARRGKRVSTRTEFKPGRVSPRKQPIGTERVRTSKQRGTLVWVKVGEPNKWEPRARVVWEKANGKLKFDQVVAHKDGDRLNDDLQNLEMISRAELGTRNSFDAFINRRAEFDEKLRKAQSKGQRARWKAKRSACACGKPSTHKVPAQMFRGDGTKFTATLRLCDSCFELENAVTA